MNHNNYKLEDIEIAEIQEFKKLIKNEDFSFKIMKSKMITIF